MMLDYVRQYQPLVPVPAPTMGTPPSITVTAGATTGNSSTFTPQLAANTGYVYFSCSTNAPKASCAITTNDPLNKQVINSASPAETVTVAVTTTANTSANTMENPMASNSIPPSRSVNPRMRVWLPISLTGFLLSLVVSPVARRRGRTCLYTFTLVAGLILMGAALSGCGSNTTTPAPPNNPGGTTPGSFSVTVFAFTETNVTDGANSHADANVVISLTVN